MEESGCPTRSYFIIDTTKALLRDLTRGRRLFRIEANGISMRAAPFCIVILQYAYSIIGFSPPFLFSFFSSIRKQHHDSTGYIVGWREKRLVKS